MVGGFPAATPAAPYLGGGFPGGGNGRWPATRWSKYVWSGGKSLAFEPPTSGEGLDTPPLLPGLPCTQTSQPFFRAIVRFSRIWREICTLWRETWDDIILKPCFRPENKL